MSYPIAFLDRHRPKTISDLVFPDDAVAEEINRQVARKMPRSTLLHGPFGSGKSVAAEVIANTILDDTFYYNGQSWIGSKLSTAAKVDELRSFLGYVPYGANFRVAIINEIHGMPADAQMALRDIMDGIERHAVLIATANSTDKIDAGVYDRFTKIYCGQPVPTQWLRRARRILAAEGVKVPDTVLLGVLNDHRTSIRDIMRGLEDLADMAHENARQQQAGGKR